MRQFTAYSLLHLTDSEPPLPHLTPSMDTSSAESTDRYSTSPNTPHEAMSTTTVPIVGKVSNHFSYT